MAEYRLLPIALQELEEALVWYAAQSLAAASRLAAEMEAAFTAIETTPDRFARWDKRHRYVRLRKFPYDIAYRIIGEDPLVVAIRHTSQNDVSFADR